MVIRSKYRQYNDQTKKKRTKDGTFSTPSPYTFWLELLSIGSELYQHSVIFHQLKETIYNQLIGMWCAWPFYYICICLNQGHQVLLFIDLFVLLCCFFVLFLMCMYVLFVCLLWFFFFTLLYFMFLLNTFLRGHF